MISKKMQEAINEQINAEMYSAYLYLSMSAYCAENTYKGFAHWLDLQAKEEYSHAMKFYNYLLDRGASIDFKTIDAPKRNFSSMAELFEQVLNHEKHVTALINKLYELALKEKDYATQIMLQWFIEEQVEEEANASEILDKLKMMGDRPGAILYLDKSMAKRE